MSKERKGQDSKKTPLSITLGLMTMLPIGSEYYVECTVDAANSFKHRWNKRNPQNKVNIKTETCLLSVVTTLDSNLEQKYLCKIKIVPHEIK